MAEGFRIARGYVEVVAEIERGAIRDSASDAGDEAGRVMGDGITRGVDGRMRDNRGRFASSGREAGAGMGESMGNSAGRTLGGVLSGHLPTIFSNPYILGAAAAAGALLAPAIGAGIAGGLLGGAGLGAIAGGLALVADRPEIKKAATSLKNRFMDIDTTDLETKVLAAQDRLARARKSKNKTAIKEAKADLHTLQADLDKAQAYNEKNFSLKDAAGPLIQPFIGAMKIFEDAAGRIIPKIGKMFAQLDSSGAITALATGLVSMAEGALPGLLKMVEASGPFLVSLGPGLTEIGKGIGFFAEQIALAGPDAQIFFKDLMNWFAGVISFTGLMIRGLSAAYSGMRSFFTSIPGWVNGAAGAVRGWWDALWARGVSVLAWLSALPGRVGGFIGGVASAVASRGAAILGWFAALPGRIGGFLATLPGQVRAFFVRAFDFATTAVGFGIGTIIRLAVTMPGRIVGAIASLRGRLISVISQAWSAGKANFLAGINAVVSYAFALPGRIYSAAVGLVARVRSVFTQAKSAATGTASSLVSAVVSMLNNLPGRAAGALRSFASRVAGALRAAVGQARSIGAAIISGVISGINSMIGAAVGAAKRAVGNIISGAKSALGIGSPSKVMAREVGRWLLPGVTTGMQSTIPAAKRAVGAAMGSLVPAAPGRPRSAGTGTLSGPSGGVNYYFAPGSITLDVSRVRSIEDLMRMIDGLQVSARAFHARTVTVGTR
jgi:hypothetical protein